MSLQLFGEVRLCHMETTSIIKCVAFDLSYCQVELYPIHYVISITKQNFCIAFSFKSFTLCTPSCYTSVSCLFYAIRSALCVVFLIISCLL